MAKNTDKPEEGSDSPAKSMAILKAGHKAYKLEMKAKMEMMKAKKPHLFAKKPQSRAKAPQSRAKPQSIAEWFLSNQKKAAACRFQKKAAAEEALKAKKKAKKEKNAPFLKKAKKAKKAKKEKKAKKGGAEGGITYHADGRVTWEGVFKFFGHPDRSRGATSSARLLSQSASAK